MEFIKVFIPMGISCMCNTVANIFWKYHFLKTPLTIENQSGIFGALASLFNFNIIIGVFFYGCSMLIFFYMLSHYKLSIVIPLTSLTFVFNIIAANIVFKESFDIKQIVGTAIIFVGIIFISQAKSIKI